MGLGRMPALQGHRREVGSDNTPFGEGGAPPSAGRQERPLAVADPASASRSMRENVTKGKVASTGTSVLGAIMPPTESLPALKHQQPQASRILAPTPIKLQCMLPFLLSYEPQIEGRKLIDGFTNGFSLGFTGERVPMSARNLKSAYDKPLIIQSKIRKEVQLGRIVGPFPSPPFDNFRCSPVGLVPQRTANEFRLIHHLSSPKGSSVNDNIDLEECAVVYSDFDESVKLIVALGRNAFMGKSDIKSAFRLLPVNPADFDLLGMCIDRQFYFDRCMPMGCSVSCAVFERFSSFLQACCRRIASSQCILHYLDDFFFAGKSADECSHLMWCFKAMCERFGVPIASEKTEGPVQVITYLGLEIDSANLQVRVPGEKVEALLGMLEEYTSKSKVTLRQMQSLIGSLNFVCRAIGPGRAFLRRLIDLTRGVTRAHHRIRISKGAKADLLAWKEFLLHFNGIVSFGDNNWKDNDFFHFYSDAAARIGFGIYFDKRWAHAQWTEEILTARYSVGFLELFPIVVGVSMWGKEIAGRKVVFWSDDQTVVAVINKQTSTCEQIMGLVRRLVVLCLKWNIWFKGITKCW